MEACFSHGDRAGGNRTAISVELKQAVCEYAQKLLIPLLSLVIIHLLNSWLYVLAIIPQTLSRIDFSAANYPLMIYLSFWISIG